MFSSLTTKLAMKKMGLPSDALDFSSKSNTGNNGSVPGLDDMEGSNSAAWPPAWMKTNKLPLTAQAWLSPTPPPVPVAAECPKPGDLAPLDRDRQLTFGGGRPVIVLFLRCVGCAFAQKSFLALRALATKNQGRLTCIAVSHSSAAATRKWMDLLGGAWAVEVVIDEDRAIYAAWGLGLGNVWSMFNPTTQIQGWKEKGWLGITVANSVQKTSGINRAASLPPAKGGKKGRAAETTTTTPPADAENVGPSTVMGNKWQQAGLFAVDGRGTVVWGTKAARADDVMDLDAAAAVLGF
ncbi:hypothetical protein F4778DRAFT_773359 [Xylariomycetidae sp. FL2044]|nr:hypothetical protein F4778DRAFT_773359 [Xylariomycetidae sp. FL2044]